MAQTPEEIAKDIIVAWLSRTEVRWRFDRATEAGEAIGKVYKAVLQAVIEGIEIINLTLKVRPQTTLLGALHAIGPDILEGMKAGDYKSVRAAAKDDPAMRQCLGA